MLTQLARDLAKADASLVASTHAVIKAVHEDVKSQLSSFHAALREGTD